MGPKDLTRYSIGKGGCPGRKGLAEAFCAWAGAGCACAGWACAGWAGAGWEAVVLMGER